MNNVQFMHKLLIFIYNNNIDEVERIYKNNVPDYMYSHLVDKKNQYKIEIDDNIKAWFSFIGNLDNANSEIFCDHILKATKK